MMYSFVLCVCDELNCDKQQAHPSLMESECKKVCKLIDCQKLSQDASSHAAQNDRLPIQTVVRVLYFEQLRLKSTVSSTTPHTTSLGGDGCGGSLSQRMMMTGGSGVASSCVSPQRDNYACLRRENRELKLEVARMRMRLTDLEKDQVSMRRELVRVGPANRLLRGLARRLGSLFHFRGAAAEPGLQQLGAKATADAKVLFQRRRRHSIS